MTKISVIGSTGRMGSLVTQAIKDDKTSILSCCMSQGDDLESAFLNSDVVIEFTNPVCMRQCLELSAKTSVPLVSGTTGHDNYELMKNCAQKVPILWAANMSRSFYVFLESVKMCASKFPEYDITIIDYHHKKKVDSPSGTALCIANAISEYNSKVDLISIRGGGIVGEHEVMFIGEDEKISMSHEVMNRMTFARGALDAAIWLSKVIVPKLYTFKDVLEN